jgi:glutathione peroxidase
MSDFYGLRVRAIDGGADLLGALRGKVTLAVNVASERGLTPQYAGLERLHAAFAAEDFTVVGFPCNPFGAQEPGSEAEIERCCRTRYAVSFPLAAKLEVNAPRRAPLYARRTDPANGCAGDIEWNFEKFLIGRDGRVRRRYPPAVRPDDQGLLQDIADAP